MVGSLVQTQFGSSVNTFFQDDCQIRRNNFMVDNARRTAEKGMCWVVMECNMCNMCNIQSMIEIFNQGLGNGCDICINEGAVEVKWRLKWYPESKIKQGM